MQILQYLFYLCLRRGIVLGGQGLPVAPRAAVCVTGPDRLLKLCVRDSYLKLSGRQKKAGRDMFIHGLTYLGTQ